MKQNTYIASYQNGKGECWDIYLIEPSWKHADKEARKLQKDFGKLWSVRRLKDKNNEN